MSGRLSGKVAIITGTGGGQGRAAALLFAREGARIVGCDLKVDGAEETVRLVTDAGGEMVSMAPVDLSDATAIESWIAFAERAYDGFDILYNNAAAARWGRLEVVTPEDFDFCVHNEVTHCLLTIKLSLPNFRRRGGGAIINTASVAGMPPGTGMPGNVSGSLMHNLVKAAVIRMSEHLAVELSPYNIRVNCISPGPIDSPATRPMLGDDPSTQMRRTWIDCLLVGRYGTPEDVAHRALYLASDEASYVTGSNLVIDGGWTASGAHGRPDPAIESFMEAAGAGIVTGGYSAEGDNR